MTERKSPRWRVWSRVLFAASLALNVLIIGALVGLLLSFGRDGGRPPPMRGGSVGPLIGLLPPQDRQAVVDELRRVGDELGVSRRNQSAERQALIGVITAEPFDADAMVQMLGDGLDRFSSFGRQSHVVLANQLSKMSIQEREAMAERLKRFDQYRKKGEHKRDPDHERGGPAR